MYAAHAALRRAALCCAGAAEVKFLNKEQEADTQNFKDKASGADLDVVDKVGRPPSPALFCLSVSLLVLRV